MDDDLWVKVDASGRLVIPREMREALGIPEDGGRLRLWVEDGELRGVGPLVALRRVQARVRELTPPGGPSLGDELRALRREEDAHGAATAPTAAPPARAPPRRPPPHSPPRQRRSAGA